MRVGSDAVGSGLFPAGFYITRLELSDSTTTELMQLLNLVSASFASVRHLNLHCNNSTVANSCKKPRIL